MKFSLIHPSRSRPEKSAQTTIEWWASASNLDNVELIISIDEDDPSKQQYIDNHIESDSSIKVIINNNRSAVDAINNAAKIATGDIFIVVSDDTGTQWEWDKIITKAIGQSTDFVMKTDDGIQKRIITMPIMDKAYFNRDGYIYNPIYDHSWADTELTEVAHLRKRVITRMDIKFPHKHYSVTGDKPDELYKRNDLTHDRDRPIYQKRKLINFGL